MLFNKKNKQIVDKWLNDPKFRAIVEEELGLPIKVKVRWDAGEIDFFGSRAGKVLSIQDILDGERQLTCI